MRGGIAVMFDLNRAAHCRGVAILMRRLAPRSAWTPIV